MAKRTRVIATYRIHEHEVIQVQVDAASSYPDALAEARATARGLVHDLLADVLAQTRIEGDAP
jgi:hypothetical protein